ADTGGGPNGAAPCADGSLVVTQNGGFDFRLMDPHRAYAPPVRRVPPGVQRVAPDGTVTSLTDGRGRFLAPNDLVVGADGALYFTDPPHKQWSPAAVGRVFRLTGGGDASPDL